MLSHTLLPLRYNIKTNQRSNSLSWSIKKNQLKKFARSKMESKKRNTHIYLYTKNTALQIETKHWRRNRLVSARTAHIKHNCFPVIRLPPRTRSWSKVIISLIFSPIAWQTNKNINIVKLNRKRDKKKTGCSKVLVLFQRGCGSLLLAWPLLALTWM